MSFPEVIYAHECDHEECSQTHLSKSPNPPEGVECASPDHTGSYEYNGGTQAYRQVRSPDGEVCDECGQVKMDAFSPEEISDLRELLDQISNVALDEDFLASLIEYKGEEVVVTKPNNVNNFITEVLDGTDLKIGTDDQEGDTE